MFYTGFEPLTASPFVWDHSYIELAPCTALRPYVRCFWGSREPYKEKGTDAAVHRLVTPDTCMDIIFHVNYTKNQISSRFCGIDDTAFYTGDAHSENLVSTFGIRFYAWTAVLFADDSMKLVKNQYFDAKQYFYKLTKELESVLPEMKDIKSRTEYAEKCLLRCLSIKKERSVVAESVGILLSHQGNMRMDRLAEKICVSKRQVERVFHEYVGISPKSLASLIRYQYVWRETLYSKYFNIADAVFRYGYTDQPHLLKEFKKYHGLSLQEAKQRAQKNVAFLQDGAEKLL